MRILALSLLLLGSPALAQEESSGGLTPEMIDAFERGCGDDRGMDRCDPETQDTMRQYYGLPQAEVLAQQRIATYRVMFVDGYGNDVAAIVFAREPGMSPYVEVRAPSRSPSDEQPLRSAITIDQWERVGGLSANFDRVLASEMADPGDRQSFCLHGWMTIAEVVSIPSPYVSSTIGFDDDGERIEQTEIAREEGRVRRDTESACANGLAIPFAFALADEAMRALPECSGLDLDEFRNAPTLLALCHRLRGDRLAAARAYEVVRTLERHLYGSGERDISGEFVSLSDEEQQRFEAAIEGAFVVYGAPDASSATDAVVEADLFYVESEEAGMPSEQAQLTLQLYDYAGDFRILSWELSPRVPFDPEAFR